MQVWFVVFWTFLLTAVNPRFAASPQPLRQLNCQKTDFAWNEQQESASRTIKTLISKAPVFLYFHLVSETKIAADARMRSLRAT